MPTLIRSAVLPSVFCTTSVDSAWNQFVPASWRMESLLGTNVNKNRCTVHKWKAYLHVVHVITCILIFMNMYILHMQDSQEHSQASSQYLDS